MPHTSSDTSAIGKFLGGLAIGIALTFAYTRYRWEMPAVARLPAMAASATISATADSDLSNWELPFEVRQRAAAVILAQNPDRFIELDNATGHGIVHEMQRQRALRRAMIHKHKWRAYDAALKKPALRKVLQRRYGASDDDQLKRNMLAADIEKDQLLDGFLHDRFPDLTREGRVDLILDAGRNRLKAPPTALAAESDPDRAI